MVSKFTVTFDPEAEQDLEDALIWYMNISEHLGRHFLTCVKERLKDLSKFPKMFAKSGSTNIRKCNVSPFPYLIFYQEIGNMVYILGIIHGYKNPIHVNTLLKNRNKSL